MAYCGPCSREFQSKRALNEHWNSVPHRFTCTRCNLHFPTPRARNQHRNVSASHNICRVCNPERDFRYQDQLFRHKEEVHHACFDCREMFHTAGELEEHLAYDHNMCWKCGKFFMSFPNLKTHLKIHAPKNVGCYGCPKMFASFSAMVLHLEARGCVSGADSRLVDNAAFNCLEGEYLGSDDPNSPFMCPRCTSTFRFMSGLLQHAESDHFHGYGPCEVFPTFQGFYGPLGNFLDALEEEILQYFPEVYEDSPYWRPRCWTWAP